VLEFGNCKPHYFRNYAKMSQTGDDSILARADTEAMMSQTIIVSRLQPLACGGIDACKLKSGRTNLSNMAVAERMMILGAVTSFLRETCLLWMLLLLVQLSGK